MRPTPFPFGGRSTSVGPPTPASLATHDGASHFAERERRDRGTSFQASAQRFEK